jgi:hypothetical protein
MTNRLKQNLVNLQELILAEAAQSTLLLEQVQTRWGLVLTTLMQADYTLYHTILLLVHPTKVRR